MVLGSAGIIWPSPRSPTLRLVGGLILAVFGLIWMIVCQWCNILSLRELILSLLGDYFSTVKHLQKTRESPVSFLSCRITCTDLRNRRRLYIQTHTNDDSYLSRFLSVQPELSCIFLTVCLYCKDYPSKNLPRLSTVLKWLVL